MQRVWVPSLVRELRSHKLRGAAKKIVIPWKTILDSCLLGGLKNNTMAYLVLMKVVVSVVRSPNSSIGTGGRGPRTVSITQLPGLWTELGQQQSRGLVPSSVPTHVGWALPGGSVAPASATTEDGRTDIKATAPGLPWRSSG